MLVNLGEIAPNDECVVVVEYTTQVTTTATGSMLMKVPYDVFPTRARGISPGLSIPVSMSFDVLMRVPGGIANVVCYYYDITHDLTKSEDVVRCKCVMDGKPLTSDFEIEVTSTQPLRTHWFVQQDDRHPKDPKAALLVVHEQSALEATQVTCQSVKCPVLPTAGFTPCSVCHEVARFYECSRRCGWGVCGRCHAQGVTDHTAIHHQLDLPMKGGVCCKCQQQATTTYQCREKCQYVVCLKCYERGWHCHSPDWGERRAEAQGLLQVHSRMATVLKLRSRAGVHSADHPELHHFQALQEGLRRSLHGRGDQLRTVPPGPLENFVGATRLALANCQRAVRQAAVRLQKGAGGEEADADLRGIILDRDRYRANHRRTLIAAVRDVQQALGTCAMGTPGPVAATENKNKNKNKNKTYADAVRADIDAHHCVSQIEKRLEWLESEDRTRGKNEVPHLCLGSGIEPSS